VSDNIWLLFQLRGLEEEFAAAEAQTDKLQARVVNLASLQHRDEVHAATFFNHGSPPRVRRFDDVRRVSAVYFRGNDSRSAGMFNNGNYRTATFHVSLATQDSEQLEYGDRIAGRAPCVRVFVIRAPFTSSGYFTDEYMNRMYLTAESGPFMGRDAPVADRVAWDVVESCWKWEGRYPLHHIADAGEQKVRGVVYLCEERYGGAKIRGGRFHYAIEYDLHLEDGVLLSESNMWMGATYQGRNFGSLQISDEEWLSMNPIPEKTAETLQDAEDHKQAAADHESPAVSQ